MKAYYTRLISAWFLLIVANRVLKGAERIMRDSIQTTPTVESFSPNGEVTVATETVGVDG